MKKFKFEVKIEFHSGMEIEFETNSDVMKLEPIEVNGASMILTEEEIGINLVQIKDMKIVEKV